MSNASRREALKRQQAAQAKAARLRKMVGVGAGLIAVALVAVFAVVTLQTTSTGNEQLKAPSMTSDGMGMTVHADRAKPGVPDVQIFADYQCPGCSAVETVFGPRLEQLAQDGDIKLTMRPRAFLDGGLKNTSSIDALRASMCADLVGAYPAYHQAVFNGQPAREGDGYTKQQLRVTFPAQAGITGDKLTTFQTCYDKGQTADAAKAISTANDKWTTEKAQANNADKDWAATPTISVNGKRVDMRTLKTNDPESIVAAIKQLAG